MGKIEYDNKGLSGAPYPALHSDSVVLLDFDFSDFDCMGFGLMKTPFTDS